MDDRTSAVLVCRFCSQKLRAPTDRGLLRITCPACRRAFDWAPGARYVMALPWLVLLAGLGLFGAYLYSVNSSKTSDDLPLPSQKIFERPIAIAALPEPKTIPASSPAEWSFENEVPQRVDFVIDQQELPAAGDKRRSFFVDQLMLTVIQKAGLSGQDKVAQDYLAAAESQRSESFRWVAAGDRLVILAPKEDEARRRVAAARAADAFVWQERREPRTIDLFQYELDQDKLLAVLSRNRSDGASAFSKEFGRFETLAADESDLSDFLKTVDDVVVLKPAGERIWVYGRKLAGRSPEGMLPAQALEAWKAHAKASSLWADHLRHVKSERERLVDDSRAREARFNLKWNAIRQNLIDLDASEGTVLQRQEDAAQEARELQTSLREEANEVATKLAAEETSVKNEMELCWRDVSKSALGGWRKVLILDPQK